MWRASPSICTPISPVFIENIEFYGNTSAASIPIALCDMQEQELLHRGERMVLAGFGSGLTWGSVLMNW